MNARYNRNFDIAVNDFGAKKSARCNLVIVKSGPSVYPIFHHDIYKVDCKDPLVSKRNRYDINIQLSTSLQ